MSYIVFTGISALFLALYDMFKKISVKDNRDIYEILFLYTFIACLCGFFYVKEAFGIGLVSIVYIFMKSGIISLSWILTMKAISKLQLSVVVPFSLLGTVFTTILAFIVFKESIGFAQVGGMCVVLIGLLLLGNMSKSEEKNDYKYLWLLVLSAFLSSVSAILDRALLKNISSGSVIFWFFLFLSLIYLVICIFKSKKISLSSIRNNLWTIGVGVSIFLSDMFYYFAVSNVNASLSIISIARKLSVFIGVVLGGIFLKEKGLLKKIFILGLMFLGLFLVICL